MTELLLIRHALPVSGVVHPELSPEGSRQAELVADWLTHENIDHLAVSPLVRARETMAPIEARLGLSAKVFDDLAEWESSQMPTTYEAIEDRGSDDRDVVALATGRYEDMAMPDEPDAYRAQAARALEDVCATFPTGRVAVLAHGGLINVMVAGVIGLDRMFWFMPGYTSITRIERLDSGRTVLRSVNEVAHLVLDHRMTTADVPAGAPHLEGRLSDQL